MENSFLSPSNVVQTAGPVNAVGSPSAAGSPSASGRDRLRLLRNRTTASPVLERLMERFESLKERLNATPKGGSSKAGNAEEGSRGIQSNIEIYQQQRACRINERVAKLSFALEQLKSDEEELELTKELLAIVEWARSIKEEVRSQIDSALSKIKAAVKDCRELDRAFARDKWARRDKARDAELEEELKKMVEKDAKVEEEMEKMRSRSRSPRGRRPDETRRSG